MSWRRRRKAFVAYKASAATLVAGLPSALPQYGNQHYGSDCGTSNTVFYWYDSSWTDPARINRAEAELARLETYRRRDGTQAIDFVNQTQLSPSQRNANAFRVRALNIAAGGLDCAANPNVIDVSTTAVNLEYLIRHEFLHALELTHASRRSALTTSTGLLDYGDNNATLAGCYPDGPFGVDDHAAISNRFDGSRNADAGFENAPGDWLSASASRVSNYKFQGNWAIQISPNGNLQQRVRVHGPALSSATYSLRYKTTGTASRSYKGRWRTLDWPTAAGGGGCNASFWDNNLDMNSLSIVFGAWNTVTNPPANASGWTNAIAGGGTQTLGAAEGHDLETIVVNGSGGDLWVDNVSIA